MFELKVGDKLENLKCLTELSYVLFQGEEGEQGPQGEVGAQGLPVKYFPVISATVVSTLNLHQEKRFLTVKQVNMGHFSLFPLSAE